MEITPAAYRHLSTEDLHAERELWLDARALARTVAAIDEADATIAHLADLLDRRI